ncbi:hypothetical protein EJ08DRAFT_731950 [Tothia fuscella]|uniref:Transcription initiation factor IIF subunit beta n=1 Tax=Tothia fuscella TaxID=1048955 RepID=A0A9P4NV52_9PEZI|nr:hypothetical protein EJ08DRAFT_731950 [Tothia fuscella]
MAAANGFKMEEDSRIKHDPEDGEVDMADVDMYEDDGELIMPSGTPRGWLLRIPNEVWQAISQHKSDDNFQIGQIKVWNQGNGQEKFRFELNPNLPQSKAIPKEYDMMHLPQATKSTFIFSEKDLEGYKPRQPGRNMGAGAQDPLKSVDSKLGGPVKVEKPRQKYRVIPKRTAVIGGVDREFSCSPRDNEEFRAIRAAKEAKEKAKGSTIQLLSGEAANALHTGSMGIGGTADAYIRTSNIEKKKRTQDNKATRMDEAALIDIIVGLFQKYKFYAMSTLKRETNQPEAYLRDIMNRIGTLIKTGPVTNHWMLNEAYNEISAADKEGTLGGIKGEGDIKGENAMFEKIKVEDVAPKSEEDLLREQRKEAANNGMDVDDDDDESEGDFEDVET